MKILSQLFLLLAFVAVLLGDCAPASVLSPASHTPTLCRQLNPADIEEGVRTSIAAQVGETPAHQTEEDHVRVEVLDYPHSLVPEGALRFALAGVPPAAPDGTAVLHGRIEDGSARPALVWARVRITVLHNTAVARQDLPARATLRQDQFEQRAVWIPFPQDTILEGSAGMVTPGAQLKRAVRAGEAISPAWLEYPFDIRRGQTVDLHIRAGAAHLRLQATALNNSRRGEIVDLRISDKVPGLAALTSGPGVAVLEAGNPAGFESGVSPLPTTQGPIQSVEAQ